MYESVEQFDGIKQRSQKRPLSISQTLTPAQTIKRKKRNHRFLDRGKTSSNEACVFKVMYIQFISLLAYPDKCITVLILFPFS